MPQECIISIMHSCPPFSVPLSLPTTAKSKSSAVKAGWICVGLGILTCWTLIGLAFFSVAMILGIVAMCSNRVGAGLAILGAALCSLTLCVFVMMGLGLWSSSPRRQHESGKGIPAQETRLLGTWQPSVEVQSHTVFVTPLLPLK